MHPDMLLLAERLVIAMESISQDVKNMSAYVYDISCSVSYLLNEGRGKECISNVAHDSGDDPSSASSAQYEEADERPSSYMDLEIGDSSFGEIGITNTDQRKNLDVLSSANNSVFTGGIKTEEQSDIEEKNESCDVDNMFDDSENNVGDYATYMTQFPGEQAKTHQTESAEDAVVVHTRVNREEEHFKCSVCGKLFMWQSALQTHSRVHTGERPYKCNVCGKAFTLSGNLTKHMRCHTRERPYICNVCGKPFSEKQTLRDHMMIHTGEKPYRCTLCGKTFRHRAGLTQHMATHPAEHPLE